MEFSKKNIKPLQKAIKDSIPKVVEQWNSIKIKQLETYLGDSCKNFFNKVSTTEKTKIISPAISNAFFKELSLILPDFKKHETTGSDYIYNGLKIELKVTLSPKETWTGNGYKKEPTHILLKFKLEDDYKISAYFSMIVNLDQTKGKWTDPDLSSNFSTLKFLNEDSEKLIICNGNFVKKMKFLHWNLQKTNNV